MSDDKPAYEELLKSASTGGCLNAWPWIRIKQALSWVPDDKEFMRDFAGHCVKVLSEDCGCLNCRAKRAMKETPDE